MFQKRIVQKINSTILHTAEEKIDTIIKVAYTVKKDTEQ
jgi:hypothetical protein